MQFSSIINEEETTCSERGEIAMIACEQAPKRSGAKKKISKRSEPSMEWGRKKAAEPVEFVLMLPMVRSLTVDKWVMNNNNMCMNVIEADAFEQKNIIREEV